MKTSRSNAEPKSTTDKLKDFYRSHLENNEPPKTKAEFETIKKMAWSDPKINLKENSRSLTKRVLSDVLKEKGIDSIEGIFKPKKSGIVGDIEANFEGAGKKIEKMMGMDSPQNPSQENRFGIFQQQSSSQQQQIPQVQTNQTFPQSQQTVMIQQKELSPAEKESNKRFIVQTMQLPKNLYAQLGIIDEDEVAKQEKPKKWGDEVDEWAVSLADWCNANGFSFPAKLEMIMLGVTGISLFVLPLVMKMMGSNADKKKESKKKEEPNKLDELLENGDLAV